MQTRPQHQHVTSHVVNPPVIDPFMRLPEVESVTGMKRSFIYSEIQKGKFPKSIRIGAQAVAWRQSEIAAWINSRGEAAK